MTNAANKTMNKTPKTPITCLFLDIGGVLLSDGWNHQARKLAAETFGLDLTDMEDRHHQTFDTYEIGKLTLDEYLHRIVFFKKRPFTPAAFEKFMMAQSKPFPEMIELMCRLKARHGLKIAVVNNEGRELNLHRIKKFKINSFADFFISSCFVHLPSGAGRCAGSGPACGLYRGPAHVCASGRDPGHPRHQAYGLPDHPRAARGIRAEPLTLE